MLFHGDRPLINEGFFEEYTSSLYFSAPDTSSFSRPGGCEHSGRIGGGQISTKKRTIEVVGLQGVVW
jgi:hypothetical protein